MVKMTVGVFLLSVIDILSGTLFFTLDMPFPTVITQFFGIFLIVKGASTLLKIPLWFGPLFALAGWVDFLAGVILFFILPPFIAHIHGLALVTKGALTIYPHLWSTGYLCVRFGRQSLSVMRRTRLLERLTNAKS